MKNGSGTGALRFDRRALVMGTAAASAVATAAVLGGAFSQAFAQGSSENGGGGEPFTGESVKKLAEELAGRDFVRPRMDVPEPFGALSPEQYRDIRFRDEAAVWRGDKIDYELRLLPLGWIYDVPVELWVVEGGKAHQLKADGTLFSLGPLLEKAPQEAPFGFSGFKIAAALNRSDVLDDVVQFQGASYFKAIGRGQQFGLSARGLAINTAQPGGEEFPLFRAFWIERPRSGSSDIVVHALLDSESTSGAFRFVIRPGQWTVFEVDQTLYPRRQLTHVGIAPLTSMFLFGGANNRLRGDVRPSAHNSCGLAVANGMGEKLWRPLTNPVTLQTSAFLDKDPKGFGLCQRDRKLATFEDLEQRFDRRPTAWIEPRGGWGEGYVELIEIPTEEEIHDNIIAYWQPAKALEPGSPHRFTYRLTWGEEAPVAWSGAKVAATRTGTSRHGGIVDFVIDFDGPAVKDIREMPAAELAASAGSISNLLVQRHPEIGGVRVRFGLNPGGTELIELRLGLKQGDQLLSESWIYRWTKA